MVKSGSSRRYRGTERHVGASRYRCRQWWRCSVLRWHSLLPQNSAVSGKIATNAPAARDRVCAMKIGCEIVDPTKRRRQDFEGQSHETKDKGNENRHRGESAGDANDGRRASERRLRAESRKADGAFHLEAQGRVRAALRGLGKGLLQGRRARRAAR